jgi:ABC-2 type transport system ATP-binding protein
MDNAIVLKKVTKTFGDTIAVRDLDLVVPDGALYGVIGPNGAGKTTVIRMVLSILFADRGDVQVLGRHSALDAKDRIGYLPEERGLYKKMRVEDFLVYMGRLKGLDGPDLERRVKEWLGRVELAGVERKRCEELSKGMQQKVQFVAAVIHRPDLLILDEPFSGLDPVNVSILKEAFLEMKRRGATIVFSTHQMDQVEELCESVVLIDHGRVLLSGPIREVRRSTGRQIVRLAVDGDTTMPWLASIPGVRVVRPGQDYTELDVDPAIDPETVLRAALEHPGVRVTQFLIDDPSIEEIFIEKVGRRPTEVQHLGDAAGDGRTPAGVAG